METTADLLRIIFHTGLILTPFYLLFMTKRKYNPILRKEDLDYDSDEYISDDEYEFDSNKANTDFTSDNDVNQGDVDSDLESELSDNLSDTIEDSSESKLSIGSNSSVDMIPMIPNMDDELNYDSDTEESNEIIKNKIKGILDDLLNG